MDGTSQHHYHQPDSNASYPIHQAGHDHPANEVTPGPPHGAEQQSGKFTEVWDAEQRGTSLLNGHGAAGSVRRSASVHSYRSGDDSQLPTRHEQEKLSRGNTLKKKSSMRRHGSLGRHSSRRSARAGSVKSLNIHSGEQGDEANSVYYCPVPTSGNPTEALTARFQTWRKVLKDLITYFREIQSHYEARSKSLTKLANVSSNVVTPPGFLKSGGIDDALQILSAFTKNAVLEANKSREIEEDVILALTGLRNDLQQKIKEIKNLSGDFKNSVTKEMDHTGKAIQELTNVLGKNDMDASSTTGKQDPYLLRLAVERQIERQIDEENYLHQAYLNLENSGRELEAIVVGEIQKAYNAYAGILKREAESALATIGELRDGPIGMPKDQEWVHYLSHNDSFVDPALPLRDPQYIHYPGRDHLAAQEIRAGLLERKSKYLKSYTAGWYVLSTTHLHEFKSADKGQAPVMSLYLPEQKLGSHSNEGGSSNKFILKGRQTGSMHRGHTWVFRAESHDTMMAWYEDIKTLTETTPEERSMFVRTHSRSLSRSSRRSASSDGEGMLDEEDEEPFSASSQIDVNPTPRQDTRRTQPGGRFPSDLQVNAQRGLQAPQSPSSFQEQPMAAAPETDTAPQVVAVGAGGYPGESRLPQDAAPEAVAGGGASPNRSPERVGGYGSQAGTPIAFVPSEAAVADYQAQQDGINPYTSETMGQTYAPGAEDRDQQTPRSEIPVPQSGSQPEIEQSGGGVSKAQAAPGTMGLNPVGEPDSEVQSLIDRDPVVAAASASASRPTGNRLDSAAAITSNIPGGYPPERTA